MAAATKANGSGKPTWNRLTANQQYRLINNAMMSRVDFFRSLLDQKRDINKECSYPDTLSAEDYKAMFDREGIANRIVRIFPEECWSMDPELYETEDQEKTAFEQGWDDLNKKFNIWSFLQRIDELSGIGRYGVLLLGIDDGQDLDQPVDGIDPVTGEPSANPATGRKLLFLRVFDESLVEIKEFESNPRSPRFGQPTIYNVKMVDPRTSAMSPTGMQVQTTDAKVHWTRLIHIADNRTSSEVLGVPRMQIVYNRLYDIRKILGADGEGFWKGGFPGLSIESQPLTDGVTPDFDLDATKEQVNEYMEGMKRYIGLIGMTAKTLTPNVAEPGPHFDTQMRAISIAIGCPLKVLIGDEQAKLSQGAGDGPQERNWNKRLMKRQEKYITPWIIRPLAERLINVGILPPPQKKSVLGGYEYDVAWPDLNAPTDNDIATIAGLLTKALAEYVAGNVSAVVPPLEFLTMILGFELDEAEAILEAAADRITELEPETPEETQARVTAENGGIPPGEEPPEQGFPS